MVWDCVDAHLQLREMLTAAKLAGELQIIRSHIQIDQNDRMPDKERLSRIKSLRDEFEESESPTSLFILGSSRLGQAKLGSESISQAYDSLVPSPKTSLGNKLDAVLALTAQDSGALFVTADKILAKKCRRYSIPVWELADLIKWLEPITWPWEGSNDYMLNCPPAE